MEKFLSLPAQKQKMIIDAALESFSTNGYKKASISDIATAAGISKSMVFHYFGTKKALYFYLIELCGKTLVDETTEKFDKSITDFFDRINLAANIEIAVIKKHPYLFSFFKSVYFETDEEVFGDIKRIFAQGEALRNQLTLDGMDISKFKEDIDPKLVMKMLVWLVEGYLSELPSKSEIDIDTLCKEFDKCLSLLKSNLYKEGQL